MQIKKENNMSKKKTKRRRLPKLTTLRNKLDNIFNKYIRIRDGKCILTSDTESLSCSHYYDKRNSPALRWDERNAHAMTIKMHWKHHHGKAPDYALWMFKNYGIPFMEQLAICATKKIKFNRTKYNTLIEHYTHKLELLQPKDCI